MASFANIEAVMAAKEANRLEFERTKVVACVRGQEVTIADLRAAFDSVCDKADWKAAWAAYVPCELVQLVIEAVKFFHADCPAVCGVQAITGRVLLEGKGYQAW
jgi:hypothetical protein